MRPKNAKLTLRAALGCALGFVVFAAGVPARAGDDDTVSPDRQFLRNVLEGLGLKRDGEAAINYQERPPLVIPSNTNLPPPERTDTALKNPAWPKDPDIERAKEQAALEKNRIVTDEREREQNPLRPDQMTTRPVSKANRARRDDGYQSPASGFASQAMPSELGYNGGLFSNMFGHKDDEEKGKFTSEPPRASLTEPPPGYQTPSPDQPYGLGKAPPPKATDDYLTRGELKH